MLTAVLLLLVGIVVIVVIIAANGYFVAQEFAYMSVDRSRLRARAAEGDTGAERALAVTERTSFMLSGAQLGITVTGLLVGYVAEPLVGESLGTLMGGVGVPTAVGIAVGTIVALVASTVFQMIFGELFPKNLAIASPEPLARRLAGSTLLYMATFGWLITIFDHAANALLRLLRIEPVHDLDSTANAPELERIVAESSSTGDLPPGLSLLIDRILDLPDHDVEHAMIPRSRVGTVSTEATVGEVRRRMAGEHTRYPVLDADDRVVGVIDLKQVLDYTVADDTLVESLLTEPLVVPTLMSLPDALAELSRSQTELACVVDEYGGFTGVLTVEDIAEELVGELTDEHDTHEADVVVPHGNGVWVMSGDAHLDEVERVVGHRLPPTDVETVSGLVIEAVGSLPDIGDEVQVDLVEDPAELVADDRLDRSLLLHVLEIERFVPHRVRVTLQERPADADPDQATDEQVRP
ncbi:hemolysin family protein [Aeromicrobium sp. CF3.5]|uniref:hemolysin family protein n=1 Tax=Aeromicrobium sp. CF3.5 TaxID=3373078 RepID=UPI003EE4CE66